MLTLCGLELPFDITSPTDVKRYKDAGEKMEQAAEEVKPVTTTADDEGYIDAYIEMLNAQLVLFGNFLDDVFGDSTAQQLLGSNPSLNRIAEINDNMAIVLEAQGNAFGVRMQKYQPNRATRRAQK